MSAPKQEIMLGNVAIARGLVEGGIDVMTAYPGTPSSEILPGVLQFRERDNLPIYIEWSVNEKVALDVALGAAMAKSWVAAAMKQVGFNVALDAALNTREVPIEGALVIISADDPGPHSSQTEQDTRQIAMIEGFAVLDPSSPQEGKEMAAYALTLSHKFGVPVILRPVNRVSHARQNVALLPVSRKVEDPPVDITALSFDERMALLAEEVKNDPPFTAQSIADFSEADFGILASGMAYHVALDILERLHLSTTVPVLKLGMFYPFPDKFVQEYVSKLKRVLILEEPDKGIEWQLDVSEKILGRESGHVPSEGELNTDRVFELLAPILKEEGLIDEIPDPPADLQAIIADMHLPPRPPNLCPGCPHRASFYAVKQVFPGGVYTGDIGCYTLGTMQGAVDTVLDMGASVNIGAGFASTYQQDKMDVPVLAEIGDSTFFHSGIHSLLDAVMRDRRFILVLLDNSITAMTGMQPTPESGNSLTGTGTPVTIPELLKACGIGWIREVDPYRVPEMMEQLRDASEYVKSPEGGVAVLWVKRPCIIYAKSQGMLETFFPRMKVTEHCIGCKVCLNTFGCPALMWNEQKQQVEINPSICIGCGTCTCVCPQNTAGSGIFSIHEDYLLNEVVL